MQGLTYKEIGEVVGLAPSTVGEHIETARKVATEEMKDLAKQLRLIEDGRLEAATDALWDAVESGDTKAVDSWIKVHGARVKLWGLSEITETAPASVASKLLDLVRANKASE